MQMRIIYEYLKIIEFLELLYSSIYLNKKQAAKIFLRLLLHIKLYSYMALRLQSLFQLFFQHSLLCLRIGPGPSILTIINEF